MNLQKAFDTTDHNKLLLKMRLIWFSPEVIDWYKSCLSSKKVYKVGLSPSKKNFFLFASMAALQKC